MSILVVFCLGTLAFYGIFGALESPRGKHGARAGYAIRLGLGFVVTAIALWYLCSPWAVAALSAAALVGFKWAKGPGWDEVAGRLGRYRLPIYLLSVFGIALLALVAIPITTFLTSPGEIDIHLNRMLRVNLRDVMVAVYAAAALYALASVAKARAMLALVAAGAFFLAWFYAFAMPFGYPMMSGLAFEQLPVSVPTMLLRSLLDLAIVVAVGFALRFVLARRGPRPIMATIVIANLSACIAAGVSAQRDHVGTAGGTASDAVVAKPLKFSRTRPNTLVIFLDRFMGSYVESILASDPGLARRLSGFTWYPRAVSAGENSIAGVHPMLGGYDYTPTEMNARNRPLRDLSVEAFSILPYNFAKKAYRVNVVSPRGLGFTMMGDCKFLAIDGVECSHIPASISHRKAVEMGFSMNALAESNYADLLVLLGSMRIAPYLLKDAIYARGPWKPFLDHSAGTTFREWAELGAFDELTEVDSGASSFNFISNILAHEPYFMGQDCLPQPTKPVIGDADLRRSGTGSFFSFQHAVAARCALLSVADYMDFLKSSGVYDNTTIAIVSDHGIVGDVEDHSSRAVAGGTTDRAYVRFRPLVLVKPAGAQGDLRVSEQYTPNAEVPAILCRDIGGCVNPYLGNKRIAALGRDDPFPVSLVPWQFSLQEPNAFVIKQQLVLKGKDPFDAKNWFVEDKPKR